MKKGARAVSRVTRFFVVVAGVVITSGLSTTSVAEDGVPLRQLPALPESVSHPNGDGLVWGQRGQIGAYAQQPAVMAVDPDGQEVYKPRQQGPAPVEGRTKDSDDHQSMRVTYAWDAQGASFCGAYVILQADLSEYKTMTFRIRGEQGGEAFEIGLLDMIANRREDAVIVGSIYRYLPGGVTTQWQEVQVPLEDFYGLDLSRIYSVVLSINESGRGRFWVDDVRFHKKSLVDRWAQIQRQGFLMLDDFDHHDLNLLGRRTMAFQQLPSQCRSARVHDEPGRGGVLRLEYEKKDQGWCGYSLMLSEVDGRVYDLTPFMSVTFDVRGQVGGETFEVAMADRHWTRIGEAVRVGRIEEFLNGPVTTQWQNVTIPLSLFNQLNLAEIESFSLIFPEKGRGVVYLDNLRFFLDPRARVQY